MKFKLFTLAWFAVIACGYAQPIPPADSSYWSRGGLTTLTFSSVTLENWASGGQNSIAINAAANLFADYRKGRESWENTLDLGYGLVRQGRGDTAQFVKSNDRINLISKYGYQISADNHQWFFSGILDFRTQFAPGYASLEQEEWNKISDFMAPGYLTLGIGIDYKPADVLSINYTPLTGKFTFVYDDSLASVGAYGVDPGENVRAEMGSYFRVKYNDEIFKNVVFESQLDLFTNYLENFGVIDVNWQNGLLMKVNNLITVNLSTHLIYDEDILIEKNGKLDSRVQFKTVFGAGLAYAFGHSRVKD